MTQGRITTTQHSKDQLRGQPSALVIISMTSYYGNCGLGGDPNSGARETFRRLRHSFCGNIGAGKQMPEEGNLLESHEPRRLQYIFTAESRDMCVLMTNSALPEMGKSCIHM